MTSKQPTDAQIVDCWNTWGRQGITSRRRAIEFVRLLLAAPHQGADALREDAEPVGGVTLLPVGTAFTAVPTLPPGAELHATLRLNYRGRYATCESIGDPRAAIQRLIEECSK